MCREAPSLRVFSRVSGKLLPVRAARVGRMVEPESFQVRRQSGPARHAGRRVRRRGPADRAAARPVRDRRNVVQGSRLISAAIGDRLRRPRPRRVLPAAGYEYADLVATSRRCWLTSSWSGWRWWAARWAPRPPWRSRSSRPSAWPRCADHARLRRRRAHRRGRRGDWERMASELERGGVDAFVDVAAPAGAGEGWRKIAREATGSAWSATSIPRRSPEALRQVPRSAAWNGLEALEQLEVPVLVVGSRDEMDHLHPLAIAPSTRAAARRGGWWSRRRASRRWPGRAPGCRRRSGTSWSGWATRPRHS